MSSNERLWVAEKPKLYVGCALTEAPETFRDDVENLKAELGANWQVLKFIGLVDGTNADVYETDLGNVETCDAFLAITDYSSTGLGMELRRAAELQRPTFLTAQVDKRVTRMVLGAAELEPSFAFERYEDMQADLPSMVNTTFAHVLEGVR